MTTASAQRMVLASAAITVTSTALATMAPTSRGGKGELPSPRILIGAGIVYTVLSLIAEPAPDLAGMFALAIGGSALTVNGIPILDEYFGVSDVAGNQAKDNRRQ